MSDRGTAMNARASAGMGAHALMIDVATYRTQFDPIIRRSSCTELVTKMRAKELAVPRGREPERARAQRRS